ncbi:MAG: permease [Sphaerochaeta sp.]
MRILLGKYRNLLGMVVILLGVSVFNLEFGKSVAHITTMQLKEMALVIPPIFILLGLLDVWVSKETMSRHMGEGSGLKGMLLAILIGSAAAGPLYGAFPVAAVFMKKGVAFRNILIFIGAWSTTKIPMLLFEIASLGPRFALTRLLVDIPGIILIACILTKLVSKDEVKRLYEKVATQ